LLSGGEFEATVRAGQIYCPGWDRSVGGDDYDEASGQAGGGDGGKVFARGGCVQHLGYGAALEKGALETAGGIPICANLSIEKS